MTGISPTNRSNFQSAVMQLEASQKIQSPVQIQAPTLDADGNPISPVMGLDAVQASEGTKKKGGAEDKFQEFVAGTFYKLMLKSLRSAQKPPKYMDGGQAEKVFQGQLDDKFADAMAKKSGHSIAGPLYPSFARAAFNRSAGNDGAAIAMSGAQRSYSPVQSPASEEVGRALNVTQ